MADEVHHRPANHIQLPQDQPEAAVPAAIATSVVAAAQPEVRPNPNPHPHRGRSHPHLAEVKSKPIYYIHLIQCHISGLGKRKSGSLPRRKSLSPSRPRKSTGAGLGSNLSMSNKQIKLSGANAVMVDHGRGLGSGGSLSRRGRPRSPERGLRRPQRSRSQERLLPPEALQPPQPSAARGRDRERSNPRESSRRSRSRDRSQSRRSRERSADSRARPSSRRDDSKSEEKKREREESKSSRTTNNEPEEGIIKEEEEGEEQGLVEDSVAEKELSTEDFSDIGDSDEEILNKENDQEGENDVMEDKAEDGDKSVGEVVDEDEADADPEAQDLYHDDSNAKESDLNLEGISDEDLDISDTDEEAKGKKTKLADALGVDWSQLITTTSKPEAESKKASKNWTPAAIFNRIGLPKSYLPNGAYDRIIDEINAQVPEGKKT